MLKTNWTSRVVLPLLLISSLLLSSACATVPAVVGSPCPAPNWEEADDYMEIVTDDPTRPFVRWVGRLINYCFPIDAEEARRSNPQ